MNKFKKKIDRKGIILIEALLALTVIVVVMTALVTALVSALSSTTFSNEQTQATAYAQEGIEIARALKNFEFATFESIPNGEYNFGDGSTSIPGTSALIGLKFERKIVVKKTSSECATGIFVSSIVKWSGSRCTSGDRCHKVIFNSCFTNLNYIEAP